jgi:hypothetical protein
MAKVLGGIASSLSGKAEGTVFVQFNGSVYTRRAPQYRKSSWTQNQGAARKRFAAINHFCRQFSPSLIPLVWKPSAVKMGGYAFFLKSNMAAFDSEGNLMDPKLLKLSVGKLTWPESFSVKRKEGEPNTIEVNWPVDKVLGGIHLKDELIVVSAGQGKYSDILETGITRKMLQGSFALPELEAEASHLYLFFGARDRRNYSESRCVEI